MNAQYLDWQNQVKTLINQEEYEKSLFLCHKCIELHPQDAINYVYLGLSYLLQGEEEEAELTWMSILFDDNQDAEASSKLLIEILDQQGYQFLNSVNVTDYAKAKTIYHKIIEINPYFADAYLALGIIAMKEDEHQMAIDYFSEFMEFEENFPKVYNFRGTCFQQLEQLTEAITDFQKAISLDDRDFDSTEKLLDCLRTTKQIELALQLADSVRQKYPDKAEGYIFLGDCFAQQNNLEGSLMNYNRALQINTSAELNLKIIDLLTPYLNQEQKFTSPENKFISSILAQTLENNTIQLSKICANLLLKNEEYNLISYQALIKIAISENKLDQVITLISSAIKKYPQNIYLYCQLAYWLENQHQLSQAQEIINQALAIEPNDLRANFLAGKIAYQRGEKESALKLLIKLADRSIENEDERKAMPQIFYEIGFILDKEKRYSEAFNYYLQAKRLQATEYQEKEAERQQLWHYFEYLQTKCKPGWHNQWKDYSLIANHDHYHTYLSQKSYPEPVFLVGFSRSGTTLLGKILDNHPRVQCLDEKAMIFVLWGNMESRWRKKANAELSTESVKVETLNLLHQSDMQQIQHLRELYFDAMQYQLEEGIKVDGNDILLDKNPFYTSEVSFIHRIFPSAKYICMIRHPLDVCLSSFFQNFDKNPYTANFFSLHQTAKTYDKMMTIWQQSIETLPVDVLTIVYEDLVDNFADTIQSVIKFLNLPWDEEILNYYQQKSSSNIIATPSYRQINRPIYKQSKYRWQNYRQEIEEIVPILEPWIKLYGYQL